MQTGRLVAFLVLAGAASIPQTASQTQPPAQRLHPLPPASKNVVTGPDAGQRIPNFRLADQSGRTRDFRSLTGRNGLLLAFVRSADW